ncbi:hypothetical protein VOLCADRAFT_101191 [Volvox carteri f. nagariensis]|uniref:Uncharacterized protein n=1 Tax=Volvox carteri f. nagariensis TaxID=3068 RepID=D8ULZ6_VOLCA|nr:uncharacterized protein VOLCADRAFT_101191 [Volvox carteri f. nagariensis]EFJ39253.1 hypothetical protein VOLCADRAFT_101191 [Volvox carteri f. nagariensis]|eukprot:XP_002959683.1 hypothetical protein VOLCADRAFT_101191 [Volvox carteri f. nagariensis]
MPWHSRMWLPGHWVPVRATNWTRTAWIGFSCLHHPTVPRPAPFCMLALDEEQYFGAEYGHQQQRTSCWACYQAEVGNKTRTYAAYLKYFVHLPAEDGAQDVHFTVADVYSGQVFSGGLVVVNMAAAQTARAGSQWEMWQDLGLPLSELKGKFCTAAPEGDRKGLMYFMPYTHFTNR